MSCLVNQYLFKFKERQDGNASIEFVLLFPAFIFLFLTGFEAGYYMVRNVMLERAVDLAVRDVRLSNGDVPVFDEVKQSICDEVGIIENCVDALQVEMRPVSVRPGGVDAMAGPTRCVDMDSTDDSSVGTTYNVGSANSLVTVRACLLAKPLFPTTGIGVGMQVDGHGNYALVATSAFVAEPGNRAFGTSASRSILVQRDAGRGNGSESGDPGVSEPVNNGGDEINGTGNL